MQHVPAVAATSAPEDFLPPAAAAFANPPHSEGGEEVAKNNTNPAAAAAHADLPAADDAPRVPLRPKFLVDWAASNTLACPYHKKHGRLPDLDAFIAHVMYECPHRPHPSPSASLSVLPVRSSPASSVGSSPSYAPSPDVSVSSRGGLFPSCNSDSDVTTAVAENATTKTNAPMVLQGFLAPFDDPALLESRAATVAVTISPGNPWFTVENTLRLLRFAASITDKPLDLVMSDTINCLNRGVKNKMLSSSVATEEKLARPFLASVVAAAAEDDELRGREIRAMPYREWAGCEQSRRDRDAVLELYRTNDEFAVAVEDFTEPWAHKPWRPTTNVHRAFAVQYFLEELSTLSVTASGREEIEVYPNASFMAACAPRELALKHLFPGRARRIHPVFAAESIVGYRTILNIFCAV